MSSPAKSEHRRSLSSHTEATSVSDQSLPIPGLSYRAPRERVQPAPHRVLSTRSSVTTTDSWKEVYKTRPSDATRPPAPEAPGVSPPGPDEDADQHLSQQAACQPPVNTIPPTSSPSRGDNAPDSESYPGDASEHEQNPQTGSAVTNTVHLRPEFEAIVNAIDLFPLNIPPPPKISRDANSDNREVMNEVRESLSYIGQTTHTSLQSQLRFQNLIIERQIAGFVEVGERLSSIQEAAQKRQDAYETDARQRQDTFLANQSIWMDKMAGMVEQVTNMVVSVKNAVDVGREK